MAANDNGLGPTGNNLGNVAHEDRLTEDCAPENVPDGPIGGTVHALQVKLLHPGLIRGNGGALDANIILFNSLRGLNGDTVLSLQRWGEE